jgi:hypothetical protein
MSPTMLDEIVFVLLPARQVAVLWSVYVDGIDQNGADARGYQGDWTIRVRVPDTSSAPAK